LRPAPPSSFFPRPQPCRCGQRRDSIPIAGGGGHGLVQPIFSAPSRLCRPDLLSTTSSRDATLKMLSITAYARAFTRSRGWPKFPNEIISYDDNESALHCHILTLRHQVYAHSDSIRYSITPFSMREVPITIIRRPALRLTVPEVNLFLTMTDKLLSAIKEKMQSIIATAERIPLPTDNTARTETQIIIHRRKGESPRKRHGLITIELEPEPLP